METNKLEEQLKNNTYLNDMLHYLERGSYLRVVNYHNTRLQDIEQFRKEVASFSKSYVGVTIEDLNSFFSTGVWPYEKPGLIPAVFEGWRTGYDVYAKVLKEYNFRGWYYIPAYFMDIPVEEQIPYCKPHHLRLMAQEDYDDPRCAMTWDELREIAKDHEICCHTGTHATIDSTTDEETIRYEVIDSKKHLEEQLHTKVSVFCWCGGDEYQKCEFAHSAIEEAGYQYVVSNTKIEKVK